MWYRWNRDAEGFCEAGTMPPENAKRVELVGFVDLRTWRTT